MHIASRVRRDVGRGVRAWILCGAACAVGCGASSALAQNASPANEAKLILQKQLGQNAVVVTHRLASGQEVFLALPRSSEKGIVESLGVDEIPAGKDGLGTLVHYTLVIDGHGSKLMETTYAVGADGSLQLVASDIGQGGAPQTVASEPCDLQGPPVCTTSWSGVWYPSATRICFVLTTTCTDPCGNQTSTDQSICRDRLPGDPQPTPPRRRVVPIIEPPNVA